MDPEITAVDQPAPDAPAEDQSIRALLEAGFDKLEAGDDEPVDVAAGADEPEVAEEAAGRAEGSDTEADASAEDSAADAEVDADASGDVQAPEHWSKDDKDRFGKLPAESRQWWLDKTKQLEAGYQDKFKEIAAIRKEADEIGAALKPVESLIQQHGISRADAVARLVGADQLLRQDLGQGLGSIVAAYGGRQIAGTDQARNLIRHLAQQLQVDIGGGAPAGDKPNGRDQAPADPRLSELEQRLQSWEQQLQAQREQEQAARLNDARATLNAFVSAKAEDGTAKHPHYDEVKDVMATFLQAGHAKTLEEAYEQAVWSRPELRKTMTKAAQEAAAKAAAQQRRSEVAKAKAAGTPKTASAKSLEPEVDHSNKSTRELLEEAFERQVGAR